jgi:ABC-type multidrug transport system fused ATPase/permease subunit
MTSFADSKDADIESGVDNNPKLGLQFSTIRQTTVVWHRINKHVDLEVAGESSRKQILFDVSGVAKPGEMIALMGPSGSG